LKHMLTPLGVNAPRMRPTNRIKAGLWHQTQACFAICTLGKSLLLRVI
jgi:hypothetical protein